MLKKESKTMKTRIISMVLSVVMGLGSTLLLGMVVQGAWSSTTSLNVVSPASSVSWSKPQGRLLANKQTILLWPIKLSGLLQEYRSWDAWLGERNSPYLIRDELLVAVRAFAAKMPDLGIETDEPQSDLIMMSGTIGTLNVLLDQLRGHSMLAQFTEDSPAQREEARLAWARSKFDEGLAIPQKLPVLGINVRTNRTANVIWGYADPGAVVEAKLIRGNGPQFLTATVVADARGLYYAYFAWDILAGDVVEVAMGNQLKKLTVPQLRISSDVSATLITVTISSTPQNIVANPEKLKVVVGGASRSMAKNGRGVFIADFATEPFRPGAPSFLVYIDGDGNRIFLPFNISVMNVRRDTSYGLPYASAHTDGISSIVWGYSTPGATLTVTLSQSGSPMFTRTVTADQSGSFSVSVDRLIADGDSVQVSDEVSGRTILVPAMIYNVDPATRTITGTAPAGITLTVSGAPHSLQISIGGNTRQITTSADGTFVADFTANAYLAGLLGTMHYTTPSGDQVYKPLFVADPLIRGKLGDWRADVILGQPDFSQITPNEVVGSEIFNPLGLYVDRSVQPNRVYVYDSGNSRVLGLSHLGYAQGGPEAGQPCTSNSDHPGSVCQVDEYRAADIVLGQPSFNMSACNGDSGYQMYPDVSMAAANTLCGLREEQMSILEGGSGATMATDVQGNLYVLDIFNNRILRYNNPFTTDTIADYVWGQTDFSGVTCNRGAGAYVRSDSRSLCLEAPPGGGDNFAGVAIDSGGNLWVADNQNNRVLRFSFSPTLGRPAEEADLVLGQPGFTTVASGASLNQMNKPASIRVDSSGVVYVADSLNNRVLVFAPPFSNGMSADRVLGSNLARPLGLEIDPNGGLWVNDTSNTRLVHFVNEIQQEVILIADVQGGLGVDRDGNVLVSMAGSFQEAARFSAPTYTLDAKFLRSVPEGGHNQTGPRGTRSGSGLEVAGGQLMYADGARILFWNNPWNLTNYQIADGVVGQSDFQTNPTWEPEFHRMRADTRGRLWVLRGTSPAYILGYELPLQMGATPALTLTSPLPLQGGGIFTWTWTLVLSGLDIQPVCDCLWLSDEESHRVFRIRNASTQPVVDIVLGQLGASGTQCNQGRGLNFPSRDSLCNPGALAFDNAGNLYVADHNLEFDGNLRLLEFDANTIPALPPSAVFGILASQVFGRNGSFTEPNCSSIWEDPMCGPWEPTFDSQGRMVIGFNGYLGPRFPMVYQDPLTNPLPIAALSDLHSMPLSARFDQFDNLYILDHNRMRILIYRNRTVETYTVTGTIRLVSGGPVPDVYIETPGYASGGISDASGVYTLTGIVTGTYILVPSKLFHTFTPVTQTITLPGSMGGYDFIATPASTPTSTYLPLIQR